MTRCFFTLIAALKCELESHHTDKILLLPVNINLNIPSKTLEKYDFSTESNL